MHKGNQFKAEPNVYSFNSTDFLHRWNSIIFQMCGSLFFSRMRADAILVVVRDV